jgi:iron complex transport system substrate-binding protein
VSSSPTSPSGTTSTVVPRRTALLGGLGAVAALVAGCAGGSDRTAASTTGSTAGSTPGPTGSGALSSGVTTTGTTSSAASAFPVTVPGKEGAVTVPSAPQRVVAVGYLRDTDLAIALGAPLVGAAKNWVFESGLAPWQKPTTAPQMFGAENGLPFEQIAALHPDLILASDDYSLSDDHPTLAKIAPTFTSGAGVGADSWQTMTTRGGAVLGAEPRAAELISSTEAAIAKARADNPVLAGKTFTFGPVSALDSIFTINSTEDASAQFFAQLGMTLSPTVTSLPGSSTPRRAQVSTEQLSVLDADVLIIAYPDESFRPTFEAQPLFKKLKAVQRGSYVALDVGTAVALAFPSVLSIPYGLSVVVPELVAAARKV